MNIVISLVMVGALTLLGFVFAQSTGLQWIGGVVIPYIAILVFLIAFILRVLAWAKVPVPFRIPTTCGQQKSHPWIKDSKLDNPSTGFGVFLRMALEILCFRSLFRNTKMEIREGPRVVYGADKLLWAAALAFHWCFLVIFIRHFRFFLEPVPWCLGFLQDLDGFLQIGVPIIFATDGVILAALTFLFLRRVFSPQLRYISLAADFFPLFLILGIAASGVLMRYITKVDIVGVKEMAMGLVTLHPTVPAGIGAIFFIHLTFVSALLVYFPFSKLMHMPGVFLSPTRNLANNNRAERHINPWNPEVKPRTYEEWEEEFQDKMKAANIPLDKEQK
ncbi:MAG: sulfate reduction electron transfer complex DsrMKJOP subunit DsrM [Planctomycetota bacterium]|jgi:nitrate reductase gamma subunit